MAKQKSESAAGQTAPGMSIDGKARQRSGNANKKPRRVSYEPAEGGGYIGETEYDNSGDGPYKQPTKSIHMDEDDAGDHLKQTFSKIDEDATLTPTEKRRAKAKASLGSSRIGEADL